MAKRTNSSEAAVTIRLLVDTVIENQAYRCNSLLVVSKSVATALISSSNADSNPEAVAYLLNEGVESIVLYEGQSLASPSPAAAEPEPAPVPSAAAAGSETVQ